MQVFHSSIKPWPTGNHTSARTEGESPIIQMMLQPQPAVTQLTTYAWGALMSNQVLRRAGTPDYAMAEILLSQATWDNRKVSNVHTASPNKQFTIHSVAKGIGPTQQPFLIRSTQKSLVALSSQEELGGNAKVLFDH